MSYDGNGNYELPTPEYPAIPGDTINAEDFNEIMADLQSALSGAVCKDGQSTMTGNLKMGTYSISNVGGMTAKAAGASFTGDYTYSVGTVTFSGTAKGVTMATGTNTTDLATCAFVNATAMSAALPAQTLGLLASDGVNANFTKTLTFALNQAKGANVAGAATLNLQATAVTGNSINITGSGAAISAITLEAGAQRTLIFAGANTLAYHATNLPLPGNANITTAAGDIMVVRGETAGPVIESYTRKDGTPVIATGSGGTTATGNVTLTVASPGSLTVTPTAPGFYATLPDATTCNKAANVFNIYNAGDYDYGLKNSAGTKLGWIRPGKASAIGLSDKSTAVGSWSPSNIEKIGITATYANPTVTGMGSMKVQVIDLDVDRYAILFGETSCYAIIYNKTTCTWGTATLVRATLGSQAWIGVKSNTDQLLVLSCSSTTALEAVTLTTSGTGITVNTGTKATAVLAGNWAVFTQLVAVGTSFAVGYGRAATTSAIRALTITGTTPTIGAEDVVNASTATGPAVFVTGTALLTITNTGTAILSKPYTVTAAAVAAGTSASDVATTTGYKVSVMPNGRWIVLYTNTTTFALIVTLTGTVATHSTVSLGTATGSLPTRAELAFIGTTKVCVAFHEGSTTLRFQIVTDTAGVISAGTEYDLTTNTAVQAIQYVNASGTTATFAYHLSAAFGVVSIDCSAASPALTSCYQTVRGSANVSLNASNSYNVRSGNYALSGSALYTLGAAYDSGPNVKFSATGIIQQSPANLTAAVVGQSCNGTTDADAWVNGIYINSTSAGAALNHLEVAA
jgi:hypothetical protein